MTQDNIPYSTQLITKEDIDAVVKVLKSQWLTQGPKIGEFEGKLAKYVGVKYAVAFSNGTAALEGAYFASALKSGDEIITSPLTFAATTNAALWMDAKPIFVDIDSVSGNIDPNIVEHKITKKTKAIVAIDYAGMPANLKSLKFLAKKYKLILIEDAAHALGASYQNKMVGSISDMTTFSFHPVKSITSGEGGAITTNNKKYYERLLLFRNHGIVKDPKYLKNKKMADWYYEMQILGHNFRMTDIQATLAISQLSKVNKFLKIRRKIAKRYLREFKYSNLLIPKESADSKSSWHLFPIRLKEKKERDKIYRSLRSAGIGVQVHYIPVYWHPFYKNLGYRKGICPKAEEFFESELSIPIFPTLTTDQQTYVVEKVKKLINEKGN